MRNFMAIFVSVTLSYNDNAIKRYKKWSWNTNKNPFLFFHDEFAVHLKVVIMKRTKWVKCQQVPFFSFEWNEALNKQPAANVSFRDRHDIDRQGVKTQC